MDYKRIYDQLIENAKERVLPEGVYVERHHIVPRCMGGGDESTNIVKLTFREHAMAHILLARVYGGVPDVGAKLKLAVAFMLNTVVNGKECRVSLRHLELVRGSSAIQKGAVLCVDATSGRKVYIKDLDSIPEGYKVGNKDVCEDRKVCKHCGRTHGEVDSDFCSSNCDMRFNAKQRIAMYDGSLNVPGKAGTIRKTVSLYGVDFPSITTASVVSGLTRKCIGRILNRGFEDPDLNRSGIAKAVRINGVEFASITQATRELGIKHKTAKRFVVS